MSPFAAAVLFPHSFDMEEQVWTLPTKQIAVLMIGDSI